MSGTAIRIKRLERFLKSDSLPAGIIAEPCWGFARDGSGFWKFYNRAGEEVPSPPGFTPNKQQVEVRWNWEPSVQNGNLQVNVWRKWPKLEDQK